MLSQPDTPYTFIPPRPWPPFITFARYVNRVYSLPRLHRVPRVTLHNPELVHQARKTAGSRLLFLPNHSTHSDPQVMSETFRQLRARVMFMAAYEVFEQSPSASWALQHSGCFSVDRDGSDSASMKQAMRTLSDGRYGLTIFPEGNVYLQNDRVNPFLEGAAFLAMKAQKDLGAGSPIMAIPVSIKLTHTTDVRDELVSRLDRLATTAGLTRSGEASFLEELHRIGLAVMRRTLQQRGILPQEDNPAPLTEQMSAAATRLVEGLELRMKLSPRKGDDLIDRFRSARRRIHQIRSDPEKGHDHPSARIWAEDALLGLRLLSYAGDYVADRPDLDRFGETLEKMTEDLYDEQAPAYGPREAHVHFAEPIDLSDSLEAFTSKARPVVQDLTRQFEEGVQAGIDASNSGLDSMGRRLFDSF